MAGVGRKSGLHAGRQKGTPNKAKGKDPYIPALDQGEKPREFLLRVMRDVKRPMELRLNAAKAAAPYCHPMLKSIDVSGHLGLTHGISAELAAFISGNATAARSFLGFDDEASDAEGEADGRPVPDR